MGRMLPTECEHGVVIDWGDFGPADESDPTCVDCDPTYAGYKALSEQLNDMSGRAFQKQRADRYRLAWLSARRRASTR